MLGGHVFAKKDQKGIPKHFRCLSSIKKKEHPVLKQYGFDFLCLQFSCILLYSCLCFLYCSPFLFFSSVCLAVYFSVCLFVSLSVCLSLCRCFVLSLFYGQFAIAFVYVLFKTILSNRFTSKNCLMNVR